MNLRIIAWLLALLSAALAVSLGLVYQRFSPTRALVRVGSKTFTQNDYKGAMEYYVGKQTINKMVYDELTAQGAQKAGLMPKDDEIEQRIKDIERRDPKQVESAHQSPVKMVELKNDLRSRIALENLRIKDVKITPTEVEDFYRKNSRLFVLPQQTQAQIVVTNNATNAENARTLLAQNIKPDVIARQRGLFVVGVNNFAPDWSRLTPAQNSQLSTAIVQTPPGKVVVVPIGNDYIVAKPVISKRQEVPPLNSIRPIVERTLKLAKAPAPIMIMKDLYESLGVTFESSKYENYFGEIKQAQDAARTQAGDKNAPVKIPDNPTKPATTPVKP